MKKNVCDNKSLRDCTGCGVCASVCSPKAITIQLDNNGFYKPVVDESKCIECGACIKSCYRYDDKLIQSDNVIKCYAAVNKNVTQLLSSSSGGVSRVLMEECIAEGYKVFGCAYNTQTNIAESIIASSIEELDQFYGSKYFQSYTVQGFEEIIKDRSEQKYALFGTPCQIYAFYKTTKYQRNPDKYLLIDIFCHGCPSFNLWKNYLTYVNKKTACERYKKISFRSKTHAWHEYCFDFFTESKQYSSKKVGDPFYELFFDMDIMNEACYDCNSRSSMAYSDIRLGDYWGEKYDTNTKGVSAVVLKSSKGVSLFDAVKDKLEIEETTFDHILIAQSYGKPHHFNPVRRNFLLNELSEGNDIRIIHHQYKKMLPLSVRVKKKIKAVVKRMPKSIYFPIKKLIHSI